MGTNDPDGPVAPYPGPEPVAPTFPVAEARTLLSQLDHFMGAVSTLTGRHADLRTELMATSSGTRIERFAEESSTAAWDLLDLAGPGASMMSTEHELLAAQIVEAERAMDAWTEDHAAWVQRTENYVDPRVRPG